MSTQGNHQAFSANWNYDYGGHWYAHSEEQGSGAYDVGPSEPGWAAGQSGLALGPMHEHHT